MIRYEEAREFAISALQKAIEKHESGDWLSISEEIEIFEQLAPEDKIEKNTLLFYVLEFWASWASCAEHTWGFEPNIKENEWPVLADELIENLKANSVVTNEKIQGICK